MYPLARGLDMVKWKLVTWSGILSETHALYLNGLASKLLATVAYNVIIHEQCEFFDGAKVP